MVRFFYVYILECADGSYYTGITNDVDRRIAQHQAGNDPRAYTWNKRPVKLVYHQQFLDANDAIAFEKRVKGWNRKKKLALIEGRFGDLPGLAKKDFGKGS
ncbi:MAG: GIY-YIG nuclease family protein [Flavobacteriales bacterium]|nr:GIY-YIG nuclease family protein [Flavobacteriales bacterium]